MTARQDSGRNFLERVWNLGENLVGFCNGLGFRFMNLGLDFVVCDSGLTTNVSASQPSLQFSLQCKYVQLKVRLGFRNQGSGSVESKPSTEPPGTLRGGSRLDHAVLEPRTDACQNSTLSRSSRKTINTKLNPNLNH